MSRSIEVQAKTIDAAIEQALEQLHASYDEVDVEILAEGGFLRKAKVLVTMKKSEKAEIKTEPVIEQKNHQKTEKNIERKATAEAEQKRGFQKDNVKAAANIQDVKQNTKQEPVKNFGNIKNRDETVYQASKSTSAEIKAQNSGTENSVKEITNADGALAVKFQKTLEFTVRLLELLENDSKVTSEITSNSFNININGDNVGMIIGKGGEVLNAFQTIVSSIAIANSNSENKRVFINVEDYKERRMETLKALALKKAEKVKETGRYIKLEPMNSRDRAIIHGALQTVEGIRTYSTGKDPYRCLCIAPKNKEENA